MLFKTIEHRTKALHRRFRMVAMVEAMTQVWVRIKDYLFGKICNLGGEGPLKYRERYVT